VKHALYLGAMALLLLACEQKSDAPAGPTNTRGATTVAAAPMTAAPVAAADDIPTEEDFEEEAAKEITADNLESEIEKLEKEIGQ
jgi:hypothetical protein